MDAPASVCAYCRKKRATHSDHVVPKSLKKTHKDIWEAAPNLCGATVPACHECNWRKGTRRLVPPSWSDYVETLNVYFPGTPWRVWMGDVTEDAYREVHV